MMYGSETWAIRKADERKMEATEMKVLRWTTGVTRLDKIRNSVTRDKMKTRSIADKIKGSRLRWMGHIERRDDTFCTKLVEHIEAPGKRRRGKPALRWHDNIKTDLKELDAKREDALDRRFWKSLTSMADPR